MVSDFLINCSQKLDVSSPGKNNDQSKSKYYLKINYPIGDAADTQDEDMEELRKQDNSPSNDTVEGISPPAPASQKVSKSPKMMFRVQETILKELGSEE